MVSPHLKRIAIALVVVVVAIVVLNWYANHVTPYRTGEIVEIQIQLCGMYKTCIVVRDPAQIEAIRATMKLKKVTPREESCDGCDVVAFVGSDFVDVATIQCGSIFLGVREEPSAKYQLPEDLGTLLRSYRDSLDLVEPCESLYSKMEAERKQFN